MRSAKVGFSDVSGRRAAFDKIYGHKWSNLLSGKNTS